MVERGRSVTYLPGRSYRKLWLADQATVELIGTGPGLDKINAAIRPDQRPETLRQFFAKRREYLVRFGIPGLDEREVEPDFWDSNFVTLRFHEWVTGTGRLGISTSYRTWDLSSGEEIDLRQWFRADAADPLPDLWALVPRRLARLPAHCSGGELTLRLAGAGLNLSEEDFGDGCARNAVIPYQRLLPVLTPAGKRAIEALLQRK